MVAEIRTTSDLMSKASHTANVLSRGLTLTLFSDPGHGWLIVPKPLAEKLGLASGDFTECSFDHGGNFYLEEDCDAGTFLAAHHKQFGCLPIIRDESTNAAAPCRTYPRCNGTDPKWKEASAYLSEALQ